MKKQATRRLLACVLIFIMMLGSFPAVLGYEGEQAVDSLSGGGVVMPPLHNPSLTISNYPNITPQGQWPSAGRHEILEGSEVTLIAGSADNWTFLGWHRSVPNIGGAIEIATSNRHFFTMPNHNVHYVAVWGNQDGVVEIVAYGAFDDGLCGTLGAPWRLYSDGRLVVDSGFIEWNPWDNSGWWRGGPWHDYRYDIFEIVFTGPITAGNSLSALFQELSNLSVIDGLSYFDTSNVTDMRSMFSGASRLTTLDLLGWDTGNVTNMRHMFDSTSGLTNLNVFDWNTSNVTTMGAMFARTGLTSLDLSNWNTSNVTHMGVMFANASGLTSLDLSNWDTSNVINMYAMFDGAGRLASLDLSDWDTSSVTDMAFMFNHTSSLRQLTLPKNFMFIDDNMLGWGNARLPVVPPNATFTGKWQNVGAGTVENPLGTYVLTSAELMENLGASALPDTWVWQRRAASGELCPTCNEDPCWAVVFGAFADGPCGTLGAPWRLYSDGRLVVDSGFVENNVLFSPWFFLRDDIFQIIFTGPITVGNNLNSLFMELEKVTAIDGLSYFDTSNATGMWGTFFGASSLTNLDLSGWNTGNVTDMGSMFSGATQLTSLDSSDWNTSNVTHMGGMLLDTPSLRRLTLGEKFTFVGYWNDAELPSIPTNATFTGRWQNVGAGTVENPLGTYALTSAELMENLGASALPDTWVWQKQSDGSICPMCNEEFCVAVDRGIFDDGPCGTPGAPWRLYGDGRLVVHSGFIHWDSWRSPWRHRRDNILEIVFTGPITAGDSLRSFFSELSNVTAINGLSYFDTSNVSDMSWMFQGATRLTNLDVSDWNTSKVTNMSAIFLNTSSLASLDVSDWNTSNVTNMSGMFWGATQLTSLDVSNWNTSNVTDIGGMFGWTSELTSLDLSSFDTSNVTRVGATFAHSGLTNLDLSSWNTVNVTDMGSMFNGANELTSLDLSGWDTSNVTNMSWMFSGASSLHRLTLPSDFTFLDDNIWGDGNARLPAVPANATYTGRWQNVGAGTVENPLGTYALTSAELMENLGATALPDTWVWQRQPEVTVAIARFHFDGGSVEVPITVGQAITASDIPIPATRYGTPGLPGQTFMGWFTVAPFNNMHYVNNPNRAVAFDFTQPITAEMLTTDGVLNLYGSWLRYGNVLGRGNENTMPNMMDHGMLHAHALGMITDADLIMKTADVNVDGNVNMTDHGILHQHLLGRQAILGVPVSASYAVITSPHPQFSVMGTIGAGTIPIQFNIWQARVLGQDPIYVAIQLGSNIRRGQLVQLSAAPIALNIIGGTQQSFRFVTGVVDDFVADRHATLFGTPMGISNDGRNILMAQMRTPVGTINSLTALSDAAVAPSGSISRVVGSVDSFSNGVLSVGGKMFSNVRGNFPVIEFYNNNDVRFGSMPIHNPTLNGRLWRTDGGVPMEDTRDGDRSNLNAVVWYDTVSNSVVAIVLIRARDRVSNLPILPLG